MQKQYQMQSIEIKKRGLNQVFTNGNISSGNKTLLYIYISSF